ncbi:MAG: alpha/beta fold hydrolase [Thermoanaerobaculia bacterium]
MKHLGAFLFLALLSPFLHAQPLQPKDPTAAATAFADAIVRKDFAAATGNYTDAMKAALPAAKLAEVWTSLQGQLGAYKRRVSTRTERQGNYNFVFFTSEFERATADLKVVVDDAGRIAGFFVVPVQAPAPEYAPPAYVDRKVFEDRDVTVASGEWALPGTLSLPAGPGPFPAVVLVHGSGPNDRDETVEAAKPFRDLAWGLASRGIAVLRYEKRTRQYGAKAGAVPNFTVQQETIDDALAAAALLRRTERIDPKRVYVLGHSLGAMLIPRIGRQDPQLAGLIAMAAAARPLEDIILEQVTYLMGQDGVVSEDEKKQIAGLREQVAKVKALKPGSTGDVLGAPASYWLDLQGYNPAEAAKALKQPLLVLQGGRDYQVTPDNFAAWRQALAGHAGATLKAYPKLNHLFIEGEGQSVPAEYQKPGHVAEAVIADIAGWIKR